MKRPARFIVIDDDLINNMLCRIIINRTIKEAEVKTFHIPEKGFEYVNKEYPGNGIPTMLFLDINMPTWSGWDFLENFEMLDKKIKDQINIYMLSSSIDPNDKQRARENRNVVDYLVKPLTEEMLLSILGEPGSNDKKV